MTLWRLIIREILHRKLDFVLGALAVFISVTALVSVIEVLDRHEDNTDSILARVQATTEQSVEDKQSAAAAEVTRNEADVAARVGQNEADVKIAVAKLENEIRKITVRMGFNIYILPKRPPSDSLLPEDEQPAYMPEEYVIRLANSEIVTIQHLLPLLECRVEWPEHGGREFILVGMRDEVPLVNRTPKKPIAQPVKDGTIILGHKLWTRLKLKVGQTVTLMGNDFTIAACYPERGTKDDSRAWVPLDKAQDMLHAKGLIKDKKVISAIWGLKCGVECDLENLAKIRKEIYALLPDTLIKEDAVKVLARAEARLEAQENGKARTESMKADGQARINRVTATGLAEIAQVRREGEEELRREKDSRNRLQGQLEMLMMVVIPVSIVGSAAWVGLMAYGSVRRRRCEIGILRAIGIRARQITTVLLVRAVLLGLIGAAAGWGMGLLVASRLAEAPEASARSAGLGLAAMGLILLAAPLLTALATIIPAAIAGRQDPATVLQEE